MKYLDVANSGTMFLLCAVPILVVVVMSIIFIHTAWKEGAEIGISKSVMKRIIASSAVFSIIPSVAVLLMLTALTFNLGKYFPWLRLSVIGSGIYETMAANMALSSFGLTNFAEMNLSSFAGVMVIMTIGILTGAVMNVLFLKKYDHIIRGNSMDKGRKSTFMPIMITAMFVGILVEWLVPDMLNFSNMLGVISMAVGLISMLICMKVEELPGCKNMESFSMSIAMVCGMAAAIIGNLIISRG